jgi:hypothetical protein
MGKSMYCARLTLSLLQRAVWIKKKYGYDRKVAINFHLNPKLMEQYKDFILYWTDPMQLIHLKDYDLVIDEVANYFPADRWKDTPRDIRRMFAQHRKRGMEIYANTQDYKMVDINYRRMLSSVNELFKIFGNRSPSATLPKIKFIWGLIGIFHLDPYSLEDDGEKKRVGLLPSLMIISRGLVNAYDTTEDIKPAPPPDYFHEEPRHCPTCGYEGKPAHY